MSQIMEKTLASLPKLLTQSFSGGKNMKPTKGHPPSQEVQLFMKVVHQARSKSQEANIVQTELSSIQQKLKQSDLIASLGLVRSSFTKIIFCHLLNYDVSCAAIHAVNLAQQGHGYEKRLGYLLSCLLLHPQHEMVMLMMATLIRDLKSANMANNCIALMVAGELVGEDNVPSILPEVIKKLRHSHELVREKALHCLRAFYRSTPSLLQPYLPQLNTFLASRDPGILTAVTNLFLILCQENAARFVNLGPSFLHILDQINHRGFGTNYYYHMVPLPWLQVSLLKILGCLGSMDAALGKAIAPLLQVLIEKTKVSEPISLAVLVESVLTATQINADEELLHLCSRCIGKLLSSDASNGMKYQGLRLLISLSRVKPSFAAQHQMAVVECLMDEDPAIQIRTMHLLHAMANQANVKAVCARLLEQMNKTVDRQFFTEAVHMISDLAERLAVDIDWYLDTYLNILDQKLSSQTRDDLIDLVISRMEKVSVDNNSISSDSLQKLIAALLRVINNYDSGQSVILLSLQLFGVLAPILGEAFSSTSFLFSAETLVSRLVSEWQQTKVTIIKPLSPSCKEVDDSHFENLINIQCCCLDTISKLVLSGSLQVDCVKEWLQTHKCKLLKHPSVSCCLDELEELLQHPEHLLLTSQIVFHSQKTELDMSLSFLDKLVVQNLLHGGGILKPMYIRLSEEKASCQVVVPTSSNPLDFPESGFSPLQSSAGENGNSTSLVSSGMTSSSLRTKNKWRDEEDEDEEHFLIVGGSDDESQRKHEEIAQELFAGLGEVGLTKVIGKVSKHPSKNNTKKWHNMWDDDDDQNHEHCITSSLGLHPFGICKKAQSFSRWHDEDVENGNLSCSLNDDSGLGFISSKSETVLSPLAPVSRLAESPMCNSFDSAHEDVASDTNVLYRSCPGAYAESTGYNQPVLSIYSEGFADFNLEKLNYGMTNPASASASTIDALTDSDPEGADS
ncbi:unnamed protein product [Candidula unifasciata]|uniref:Clathrin/coatomer adaptor adaptin-like N-terminal domain-containing protein n=1 Tax=Candidula unifasciata TaxID=100452 RepID=A0A8S3ZKP5_9EUPU|nr:unnamed protein product [Candidula unifasciata]